MTDQSIEHPGILVSNQQMVETLQRAIIAAPRDVNIVRGNLRRALQENAWMDRLDVHRGIRFRYTAEQFVKFVQDPLPDGLETSVDLLRKLIAEDVELVGMFEAAVTRGPGNPTGANQHRTAEGGNRDNVPNSSPVPEADRGNSLSYAARRLLRDRPDLFERVKAGEMSCHAAMVAAGFRKVPTPLDILRRAWARASEDERAQFREVIGP